MTVLDKYLSSTETVNVVMLLMSSFNQSVGGSVPRSGDVTDVYTCPPVTARLRNDDNVTLARLRHANSDGAQITGWQQGFSGIRTSLSLSLLLPTFHGFSWIELALISLSQMNGFTA